MKKIQPAIVKTFMDNKGITSPIYANLVFNTFTDSDRTAVFHKLLQLSYDGMPNDFASNESKPVGYFAACLTPGAVTPTTHSQIQIQFSICNPQDFEMFHGPYGKFLAIQRAISPARSWNLDADIAAGISLDKNAVIAGGEAVVDKDKPGIKVLNNHKLLTLSANDVKRQKEHNKCNGSYFQFHGHMWDGHFFVFKNGNFIYDQYLVFLDRVKRYYRLDEYGDGIEEQ